MCVNNVKVTTIKLINLFIAYSLNFCMDIKTPYIYYFSNEKRHKEIAFYLFLYSSD